MVSNAKLDSCHILYHLSAFYSMKMRYDESDNILVRTSRAVTDRVEDAFS